jgi:hypothetical protein
MEFLFFLNFFLDFVFCTCYSEEKTMVNHMDLVRKPLEIVNSEKIGEMDIQKGNVREGVTLFSWDIVQSCQSNCPVYNRCQFEKGGKCLVQVDYLKAFYQTIFSTYQFLDEVMTFKLGVQIVPLYMQLCRLQLLEMSITSVMVPTPQGEKIHPVYKEIRETLKTIHIMWKDLELAFTFNYKPNLGDDVNKSETGDRSYYKQMSQEDTNKKGVIR